MRATILYPLLVGGPLIGLIVILRVGEGIVPPHSIGGEWDLTLVEPVATPGCSGFPFADAPSGFSIAQSGVRASLTFASSEQTSLSIEIEGEVIRGTGTGTNGEPCLFGPAILDGRLVGTPGAERIEGTLERAGCETCPSVTFVANRRPTGGSES